MATHVDLLLVLHVYQQAGDVGPENLSGYIPVHGYMVRTCATPARQAAYLKPFRTGNRLKTMAWTVRPGLNCPLDVDWVPTSAMCQDRTAESTNQANRERERDAHRVGNTDLEETWNDG